MDYAKRYKEFKTTEEMVKDILTKRPATRDDDFILYGWVLYYNGISLDQSLRQFLGGAARAGVPAFATVTKCRRTLQGKHAELRGESFKARQDMQMIYKTYNMKNN